MTEECLELQNIKYQTMLLNGNSTVVSSKKESGNIASFLNKEKAINKDKPWSKLGKHLKIKLLYNYIDCFCKENDCNDSEKVNLKKYIMRCLERKKLARVKDVTYDSKNAVIKNIPGLSFDKTKRNFTLRKIDRKNKSTLRGMAPTRSKKNKIKLKKTTSRPKKDKIDIKPK